MQQGQIAHDQGRSVQARAFYKKALDADPHNYDAAFLTAITYAQQDNLKMASGFFRRATEIDPKIAEGHFNLGYALQLLKNYDGAAEAYRAALSLRPDYHKAWHNLGVVHEALGEFEDALVSFERALALQPDAAETYYDYGSVLMQLGRNEEALVKLDRAIELVPNHVKALNNRGLIYIALQRYREAMESYDLAIAIEPENADLHYHKGLAAFDGKSMQRAADAFTTAVRLKPDIVGAWLKLGFSLDVMKRSDEALAAFERVRKLSPGMAFVDGYIQSARLSMCDWSSYEQNVCRILEGITSCRATISPHAALLLPSTRHQRLKAAEIWRNIEVGEAQSAPPVRSAAESKRIKVAYFSPDYHMHPVAMLTARMFELHDRSRFEIYAFSIGSPSRDPMRLRIEAGVDHFINARELVDIEIVEKARAEGIDIAVNMTGYTADGRPRIFAKRVAPIQINYLGFSGTMGADFMDYIIGDPVLIPPEHALGYTEKIIRLPDCYMPSDPTREISDRRVTRAEYGLPEQGFVFCAFNNPNKLCPPQFDVWMRILAVVPGSVLWLSPAPTKTADNLRREAQKRSIDPARLIFANREDRWADHLARHRLADLFLDTLPHNAHATANDALWAGLPVLTRLGEGYAGRVAGSLVKAVGMSDLIAGDEDEYQRLAIEIALTPGKSHELKERLARLRETSSLFDCARYTRNIERAYEAAMARAAAGLVPDHIDLV
jgi:predicted O-linked N-acetylglucosamine transferase (SPINDLY family)